MYYHLASRCVRRSWLCGFDELTKTNYDHRKAWLEDRLFELTKCFALALHGYAIMSNHFHLVVYFDPIEASRWSDEEVVDRWLNAFPPTVTKSDTDLASPREIQRNEMLEDPEQIAHARETLGSLSMFMKHLKQPFARAANKEDDCKGHFFESRFYSGALLTEEAVLSAMVYVDLNPVRADIIRTIEESEYTSLAHRLKVHTNNAASLAEYIGPVVSGITQAAPEVLILPMTVQGYLDHLETLTNKAVTTDVKTQWLQRIHAFHHRQRAYGSKDSLQNWSKRRGWNRPGKALA